MTSASERRIGVFGGSFNPIHNGHLAVARAAIGAHELDEVLLVPAASPPHKRTRELAPAPDRLAMARLGAAEDDRIGVSAVELERDGPSYTVDTLAELRRRFPASELFFIVGADSWIDFPTWRDPAGILALARLVVVNRPGVAFDWTDDAFARRFSPADLLRLQNDAVTMPPSPVEATDLRALVRAGESIKRFVPPGVAEYIAARGLYRDG